MSRISFAVTVGLCVIGVNPVAAQDKPDGAPPDAKQVLLDVYAHYRSLDAYSASVSSTTDAEMKGSNGMFGAMGQGIKQRATFRFARPDHVYYESDQVIAVSDGETLSYGMPMMMEYLETPAPSGLDDLSRWVQPMVGVPSGRDSAMLVDPLSMLVHDEADTQRFLAELNDLTAAHENDDGDPHIHITATVSAVTMGMPMATDTVTLLELWIDPQRRLITRVRLDMTETMNVMREMAEDQVNPAMRDMQYERMIVSLDLEDQQLSPAFDDRAFVYDWKTEGYEKADPTSQFASMFGGRPLRNPARPSSIDSIGAAWYAEFFAALGDNGQEFSGAILYTRPGPTGLVFVDGKAAAQVFKLVSQNQDMVLGILYNPEEHTDPPPMQLQLLTKKQEYGVVWGEPGDPVVVCDLTLPQARQVLNDGGVPKSLQVAIVDAAQAAKWVPNLPTPNQYGRILRVSPDGHFDGAQGDAEETPED